MASRGETRWCQIFRKARWRERDGVTLLEILISFAILGLVFGVGTFVSLDFYRQSVVASERDVLAVLLKRARSQAMSNMNQKNHGLWIDPSSYVLFQGPSYAGRDQEYDESFKRTSGVTVNGPSEIIFQALDGQSNVSTTLTLNNQANKNLNIFINNEGRIDW